MTLGGRPSEATLRAALHAHVVRLLTPALQAEAVTLAPEYKKRRLQGSCRCVVRARRRIGTMSGPRWWS